MVSRKKQIRRTVTGLLFFAFSIILFFNNVSQALSNYTTLTQEQLMWIAWAGIIGSAVYAIFKASGDEF